MKRENAPALNKEQLENVEKVGGVLSLGKAESQAAPTGLVLVFLQKQGRVNIKIKEEKICNQKTRSITLQKNSKWHKKMKGT